MIMHYLVLWLNIQDTTQDPSGTHSFRLGVDSKGWRWGALRFSDISVPCLAQACASSRRTQSSGTCLSSATAATGWAAHI